MWPSGCVLRTILVAFEDYSRCVRARSASVGCHRYDFHSRCKGNNLSLRFTNVLQEIFHFSAIFFALAVAVLTTIDPAGARHSSSELGSALALLQRCSVAVPK